MRKASIVDKCGGPEILAYQDYHVGGPGPGEARVHNTAIGVTYR